MFKNGGKLQRNKVDKIVSTESTELSQNKKPRYKYVTKDINEIIRSELSNLK